MMQRMQNFIVICLIVFSGWVARPLCGQALPAGIGPGSQVRIGGAVSAYRLDYGQRWLGGGQVWVDADLFRRWTVEAEARRLRFNQDENAHADTYLIGPRIAFRSRALEPYAKLMAGSGHFNFPFNYARGNYFVWAAGGGVDLNVADRWQVRVVDVEYQKWPQFSFGSMKSYGVSVGISYTILRGPTRMSR